MTNANSKKLILIPLGLPQMLPCGQAFILLLLFFFLNTLKVKQPNP